MLNFQCYTQMMTLRGTGDLILHRGGLHIQPSEGPKSTPWHDQTPPAALAVSGGSLGVSGGGAEISSSRTNAPVLALSAGLHGKRGMMTSTRGKVPKGQDTPFLYSGVALTVNVRETANGSKKTTISDRFRLLELSVGGGGKEEDDGGEGGGEEGREEGVEGDGEKIVLMSVRGDGRISMSGGGGVVLEEGGLEVTRGNATFKVRTKILYEVCTRRAFFSSDSAT